MNRLANRTTETTVTFNRPFNLSAFDHRQPAGTYRLVIDEEELPGLTFLTYVRTATTLHTPAILSPGARREAFLINPVELKSALEADMRSLSEVEM